MKRTLVCLLVLIAAIVVLALMLGDEAIPPPEVLRALLGSSDVNAAARLIVMEIRLPRVLLALLVGMALAVAGAIVQTIMRNPLAEPGLLGINSGAALAALVLIVQFDMPATRYVSMVAFAGALVMTLAIYGLSWRAGANSVRIILIGIGLSALAGALSSYITAFGDVTAVQYAQVWLSGSVYSATWEKVWVLAAWLVLPFVLVLAASRDLDLLDLGEGPARGLGQRVELVRALMILACALLSGAADAAAGLIGFIGLIAPHAARRMVGRRHTRLLPVAALTGGVLLISADLVGRTVIAPAQLPAGLVSALVGAPFFAFLLWERRHVRI